MRESMFIFLYYNPEQPFTPLFDPERSLFFSSDIFKVDKIFVIHDGNVFNFRFAYNLGAFDYDYITKIDDHMFNFISR